MYWKEIPVQVQATKDSETQSLPLDSRFQEAVDAISMMEGSYGSDEYLDAWDDVLNSVVDRYNKGMPQNFVAKLRDLHTNGSRTPSAGSIDGWIKSN